MVIVDIQKERNTDAFMRDAGIRRRALRDPEGSVRTQFDIIKANGGVRTRS